MLSAWRQSIESGQPFTDEHGEVGSAMTTAILFVVATFVGYMRWEVNPILPRLRA